MDFWIVSSFGILQIEFLWTFTCVSFGEYLSTYLLGTYLEVGIAENRYQLTFDASSLLNMNRHPKSLLWFVYEMSPQTSHVFRAWSPMQAGFRAGAFGKWLNRKSSDFLNELIHWWVQNLNRLLGSGRIVEGGAWLEEVGHWSVSLKDILLCPLPSSQPLFASPGNEMCSLCHTLLTPWCSASP
jgi:hypothetical protein